MLATATAADRRTRKRQAYLSWRKRTRAAARVALAEHVQLRRCLRRAIHAWRNRPVRRRFVGLMDVRTEIALLLESASVSVDVDVVQHQQQHHLSELSQANSPGVSYSYDDICARVLEEVETFKADMGFLYNGVDEEGEPFRYSITNDMELKTVLDAIAEDEGDFLVLYVNTYYL